VPEDDAMDDCTSKPGDEKEIQEFGPDSIEMAMRLRIRDTIEELVKQELDAIKTDGPSPEISNR
jgi:hypothetical protein